MTFTSMLNHTSYFDKITLGSNWFVDEFTYLMLSGFTIFCHISMLNHISYFEIKKNLIIFGQNLQLLAIVHGVTKFSMNALTNFLSKLLTKFLTIFLRKFLTNFLSIFFDEVFEEVFEISGYFIF